MPSLPLLLLHSPPMRLPALCSQAAAMLKLTLGASLSLFLSLSLGSCSAPTAKVMPLLASVGLDGNLSIMDSSSSGGGSTSSSFSELGVGENEAGLGGLVRIGLDGAELSITAIGLDFEGTGTTQSQFELDGEVIAEDTDVNTDISLQMFRGMFTWDLIPIGGVDFGIGVGATLLDLDFEMQDTAGLATVRTDQLIPVPLLGARAAWTWGPVDLRADVSGFVIKYDGDEATVLDADIAASVELLDIGDLVVGYRVTRVDAVYQDESATVDTDVGLEGYYFGLQFGF